MVEQKTILSVYSASLVFPFYQKDYKNNLQKIFLNSNLCSFVSFRFFPNNCTDYLSYINNNILARPKKTDTTSTKAVKYINFNYLSLLNSERHDCIETLDTKRRRNKYFSDIDLEWIFQKENKDISDSYDFRDEIKEDISEKGSGFLDIEKIECQDNNLDYILYTEVNEKDVVSYDEYDFIGLSADIGEYDQYYEAEYEDVDISGKMSREERATQEAVELSIKLDLESCDLEIISRIFISNGWGACKEALIRELENGATIYEIESAANIKEIWKEHSEFYSGQKSNYRILSWPTAIKFIRKFSECPSPEEAEHFLIALYKHWYFSDYQRNVFSSFNKYFITCLHSWDNEFGWASILTNQHDMPDEYFFPPSSVDIPVFHQEYLGKTLKFIRSVENLFD
uniref:hypothetical protein n=1 Tax=Candidatus Electronema sp. TaxID=2698783 RepID=UPI00405788B4